MAGDRDGAFMAHISDKLEEHSARFVAIEGVLGLMLDTLQAQTEMLTELLNAAREEPGLSPVARALEALATAVGENTEAVNGMARTMEEMASHLDPTEPVEHAPPQT